MFKNIIKTLTVVSFLASFSAYSSQKAEWEDSLQNELRLHGVKTGVPIIKDKTHVDTRDIDVDIIIDDFDKIIVDIDNDNYHDHYHPPRPPIYYPPNYDYDYYDDDSYMSRYLNKTKRNSFCRSMASNERDKHLNYAIQDSCHKELSYLPITRINNGRYGTVYVFEYKSDYQFCLGMARHYRRTSEHERFLKRCSLKIERLPYLF